MSYYIASDEDLTSVADALREVTGTSGFLEFPDDYIDTIENLESNKSFLAFSGNNSLLMDHIVQDGLAKPVIRPCFYTMLDYETTDSLSKVLFYDDTFSEFCGGISQENIPFDYEFEIPNDVYFVQLQDPYNFESITTNKNQACTTFINDDPINNFITTIGNDNINIIEIELFSDKIRLHFCIFDENSGENIRTGRYFDINGQLYLSNGIIFSKHLTALEYNLYSNSFFGICATDNNNNNNNNGSGWIKSSSYPMLYWIIMKEPDDLYYTQYKTATYNENTGRYHSTVDFKKINFKIASAEDFEQNGEYYITKINLEDIPQFDENHFYGFPSYEGTLGSTMYYDLDIDSDNVNECLKISQSTGNFTICLNRTFTPPINTLATFPKNFSKQGGIGLGCPPPPYNTPINNNSDDSGESR